jgi:hypothetical protein
VKTASVADLTATGSAFSAGEHSTQALREPVKPVPFILTRRVAGSSSLAASSVVTSTSETLRNEGIAPLHLGEEVVSLLQGPQVRLLVVDDDHAPVLRARRREGRREA